MSEDAPGGDEGAAGWDAIDRALEPLYGDREPERHMGTVIKWMHGGPDPIDGISAYKVTELGPPHWHIVTYGMTELYGKESEDPNVSGWGFEFTMRVACAAGDDEPPIWPFTFLQNLGRYVFETGNVFDIGHYLDLHGPIEIDRPESEIRAATLCVPPRLPLVNPSAHGDFSFIHVLGITLDELHAMQTWDARKAQDLLRGRDPLLLTDVDRHSAMKDPAFRQAVDEGRQRDGSSQAGIHVAETLRFVDKRGKKLRITVGAIVIPDLVRLVEGRTLHDRPFYLAGPEQHITFTPGATFGWETEGHELTVTLSPESARALLELPQKRGKHDFPALPGLRVVVEKTKIRDRDGSVIDTVG